MVHQPQDAAGSQPNPCPRIRRCENPVEPPDRATKRSTPIFRQDGNSTLFWQKFVGPSDPDAPFRRCGWTHVLPNTTVEYDYRTNYSEVLSDIADWMPNGTGQKTRVSAHTWGDHPYTWPAGMTPKSQEDRNEAHWYIYWMQSMPGRGNAIPFGQQRMTNWWRFTGDWEGSIRNRLGLYR